MCNRLTGALLLTLWSLRISLAGRCLRILERISKGSESRVSMVKGGGQRSWVQRSEERSNPRNEEVGKYMLLERRKPRSYNGSVARIVIAVRLHQQCGWSTRAALRCVRVVHGRQKRTKGRKKSLDTHDERGTAVKGCNVTGSGVNQRRGAHLRRFAFHKPKDASKNT